MAEPGILARPAQGPRPPRPDSGAALGPDPCERAAEPYTERAHIRMRVTAEVKQDTRERLLRVARRLFSSRGYTRTTTRDIAAKSNLAPGTPFNYFRSKEALATALFAESVVAARESYFAHRRPRATLAEELFAHALGELKALEPFRSFCAEVFARSLSPFAPDAGDGDELRRAHVEAVGRLLALHRVDPDPALLQLYWTLYLGVLAA